MYKNYKQIATIVILLTLCSFQFANADLTSIVKPSIDIMSQTSQGSFNIYYPGDNGTSSVLTLTSLLMQDVSSQNSYFSIGEPENNDTICVGNFWQTDKFSYALVYPDYLCNATPICKVQELTWDEALTSTYNNQNFGYAGEVFLDSYSASVQQFIGRVNEEGKPTTMILYMDPVTGILLGTVYPQTDQLTGSQQNVPYFMEFFFTNATNDAPDAGFFEIPEICLYEAAVIYQSKELAAELKKLQKDINQLVKQLKTLKKQQLEAKEKGKKDKKDTNSSEMDGDINQLYYSAMKVYHNEQFAQFIAKKKLKFRGSAFQEDNTDVNNTQSDMNFNSTDNSTDTDTQDNSTLTNTTKKHKKEKKEKNDKNEKNKKNEKNNKDSKKDKKEKKIKNETIQVDEEVQRNEKIQQLNQLKQNLTDLKEQLEDALNNTQNVSQEEIDNYQSQLDELEEEGQSLGVIQKEKKNKKSATSKKHKMTKKHSKKSKKSKKGKNKEKKGKKDKKSKKDKNGKKDKKNKSKKDKKKGKKGKKSGKKGKKSKKHKKSKKSSKKHKKKSHKKKIMFEQLQNFPSYYNAEQIRSINQQTSWPQQEQNWGKKIFESKKTK